MGRGCWRRSTKPREVCVWFLRQETQEHVCKLPAMLGESGEAAGEDGQTAIGVKVLRSLGLGVGGSGGGGDMREWGGWGLDPRREWGCLVRAALREKARAGGTHPPSRSKHVTKPGSLISVLTFPATHERITVAGPRCPHPRAWAHEGAHPSS